VAITVDGGRIELPVIVQPGMHHAAIAVAVGYGRTAAGPLGDGVGVNAFPLAKAAGVRLDRVRSSASVEVKGTVIALALSQTQASLEGRPHVKETTLAEFLKDPAAGNEEEAEVNASMWKKHAYDGHRWVMSIDLTACTGCSACVISCQAENNVPIVGVDEVRRNREMSWMRIDRYYGGDAESPTVVHQPIMCQHCENAPCETVCPVLATVHSSEGLNQQVYNRCVGTRYCANNCPPKVRRFNWFDYHDTGDGGPGIKLDDPVSRMVLNPDVVVRTRGVMEKCSMCVQRIQEGKGRARHEHRDVKDGDIETACQQSCPAKAIVFGDINDPKSQVAKLAHSERSYRVLAEIGIEPAVRYLTKVRNTGEET
jgi:molybdopterin-containing oxidoreductase family iron-sulfur binding subunit